MARTKAAHPTAWEVAKPLLTKDYNDGKVTDLMKPKDVWETRPEFKKVKYENFRSNFSRLKRTTKENKERANADEAGYRHDMTLYTLAKQTDGYWDGSQAQALLKRDMKEGRHKQMKPKFLWLSRPEYRKFTLDKFRGHIHQEQRREHETNYWIVKMKKKKNAAEAKKSGKNFNEEDVDYLFDPVLIL